MSLPDFEDYTYDITPTEQTIVEPIIKLLQGCSGKANCILNQQIITYIVQHHNITTTPPRVRKIINYIRTKGLLPGLLATSNGYYVSADPKEVMRYVDSLAGREFAISRIKLGMITYARQLLDEAGKLAPPEPLRRHQAIKLYEHIKATVSEDKVPEYTPMLIGNLSYSMSIPNFLHLVMGYNKECIEAMLEFFKTENDLTRYNLLNEQIERVRRESPDWLFTGSLISRAA